MGIGQGSGAVGWCYVCVRCESGFLELSDLCFPIVCMYSLAFGACL